MTGAVIVVSAVLAGAALVVGAALAGALVAGPLVSHAVTWWIAWRAVVLPLLGRVPDRRELGRPWAACPRCGIAGPRRAAGAARPGAGGAMPWVPGPVAGLAGGRRGGHRRPVRGRRRGGGGRSGPGAGARPGHRPGGHGGGRPGGDADPVPVRVPHRGAVVAGLVAVSLVDRTPWRLWGAVLGAAVYGGMLLVLHLASPRMLGFGDVRLALVGLAVGWRGWDEAQPVFGPVQVVLNAALLAAVAGVWRAWSCWWSGAGTRRSRSARRSPPPACGVPGRHLIVPASVMRVICTARDAGTGDSVVAVLRYHRRRVPRPRPRRHRRGAARRLAGDARRHQ